MHPHHVFLTEHLEVNQILYNLWVLTEAYQHGMYHNSEEDIEAKR